MPILRRVFRRLFACEDMHEAQLAYFEEMMLPEEDRLQNYKVVAGSLNPRSIETAYTVAEKGYLSPDDCMTQAVRAKSAALVKKLLLLDDVVEYDILHFVRECVQYGSNAALEALLEGYKGAVWRELAAECMTTAAMQGRLSFVKQLVALGADPFVRKGEESVWAIATPNVVRFLMRKYPVQFLAPP